jgi:hypothetical protein
MAKSKSRPVPFLTGRVRSIAICVMAIMALGVQEAPAYSVLTHEQIVDLLWKDQIQPMLKARFPNTSDDDIRKAHAYAYGGSMVQDMGYYPFGNKFFSDLLHYVRSGDFVLNLLHEASDVNEYGFALGALAHYVSDNTGHPTINRVVAIEFPKLRRKFGDVVTYDDDKKAHIRTEFGFDMVQVAKNRYTSDRYHDFIGFEVAKPLLERTFLSTYGLKLGDAFGDTDLAIGTFRRSVSVLIPQMTRVALLSRKKQMIKEDPTFDQKKFLFYLSRTSYEKQWGTGYRKPGIGTRVLSWFLSVIPKFGPFAALQFKIPTQQTEDLYIKSVTRTIEDYRAALQEADANSLHLPNLDCDTGKPTAAGEYRLSDTTYATLLEKLSKNHFDDVSPELRADLLRFYSGPQPAPKPTRKSGKEKQSWEEIQKQLKELQSSG